MLITYILSLLGLCSILLTSVIFKKQKKTFAELEDQNILYKTLFDSVPEIVWLGDADGKVTYLNKAWYDKMGTTPEKSLGIKWTNYVHPDDVSTLLKKWENAHIYGEKYSGECRFITERGKTLTITFIGVPVKNKDGKVTHWIGVNTDITEIRSQQAHRQTSAKLVALGEMAGGIAHEINTPLAILMNIVDRQFKTISKENNAVSEDVRKIMTKRLNMENSAVTKMSGIVKGLKLFARDGSNDPLESVSVKTIIDDTLSFCETKLRNNNITIRKKIKKDLDILCRPTQISQVLINLINNSRDAIEELTIKWINVDAYSENDCTYITITDSGSGIPRDIQNRMMQPFFTTKPVGKGTGLGLSISTGIINRLGGKLYIDNDCVNTRFIIKLPKIVKDQKAA